MIKSTKYEKMLPLAHLAVEKKKPQFVKKKIEIKISEFNTTKWHDTSFYKHIHRLIIIKSEPNKIT